MKNLSKLNGAKALSKKEQMSINGGKEAGCRFTVGCYNSLSECQDSLFGVGTMGICIRETCTDNFGAHVKYCVISNFDMV